MQTDSIIVCNIPEEVPPAAQNFDPLHQHFRIEEAEPKRVRRHSGILMLAYSAKQAHSGRTLDLRNITARPPTSSTSTGPPFKTITENLTSGGNKLKHGKLSADKPHYARRFGRYFVATTLGDGFTIGKR